MWRGSRRCMCSQTRSHTRMIQTLPLTRATNCRLESPRNSRLDLPPVMLAARKAALGSPDRCMRRAHDFHSGPSPRIQWAPLYDCTPRQRRATIGFSLSFSLLLVVELLRNPTPTCIRSAGNRRQERIPPSVPTGSNIKNRVVRRVVRNGIPCSSIGERQR